MTSDTPPLDAPARAALRAKAEALRAAITACPPFKFTIEPHVNGSAYLSDAQSEVWQAFMALTYACTPDVILALLAAVERGAEDTELTAHTVLQGLVGFIGSGENKRGRFPATLTELSEDCNDYLAARSATPTEGDDHA